MTIRIDELTAEEFLERSTTELGRLLVELAWEVIRIGVEYARAMKSYQLSKLGDKQDLAEHTAAKASLEILYDATKHAVSALQTAFRAETA